MGVSGEVLEKKLVYYIVAAALLASLVPLQANIDKRRVEEKLVTQDRPAIRPGEAAIGLLLAGFRGVAANMLWFRATVLFEQERVTEEIPLFQAISFLQPRFRATWSFGAWHMAYNVSAHFYERPDLTDEEVDRYRFECFKIGEAFLRKGTQYNYYHYDLHWDLGFSILYYKEYKLMKEKGWAGANEALEAALSEMKTAALFQPPLAEHPAYVDRIIAIVMQEGGMLEDSYKVWYRLANPPANPDRIISIIVKEGAMSQKEASDVWQQLKGFRENSQNMKLVKKHMDRVIEQIHVEDAKRYALDREKEGKLEEAYKVWYNLLTEARRKQAELAENKWSDPDEVKQVDENVTSFAENVERLGGALKKQNVNLESLQKEVLEKGTPSELRKQIDEHFQRLDADAETDREADMVKTMRMYRELTKPAPGLDWWILLFVPLLLLAMGNLVFGKETYAS